MKTKKLVLTAFFVALGVTLPFVIIRSQEIRSLISPMHIAPLLAGLTVGPIEGLIVGILSPILSSLLTGMPAAPRVPGMVVELAFYGLVGGLGMKYLPLKGMKKVYVSLIIAMICGRIAGGLVQAFIMNPGNYSLAIWTTSYVTGTLPGMVIQIIFIPLVVRALQKANLAQK